jgi:L-aspartate oxidase
LVSSDLIELRNLITTAQITVESAISRTESRGLFGAKFIVWEF